MNADVFAEWMRRQGHRVYRTRSSYWNEAGPRVFQAFPYHWLIRPDGGELRSLLVGRGILALRYSTALDAPQGMVSYHVVLHGPYELEMLRDQARNGVRRGLKHFQVERIPLARLADEGWRLQQDTLERQGRTRSMTRPAWERTCSACEGLPGFEAWGAIAGGELAGALLTTQIDDTAYVPFAMSHRQHLGNHVNNALFYRVSCELLSRTGISSIFFSTHSLDAPPSVDEFKFRMSLIPRPVRQRVVFHPLLEALAGRGTHALIASLCRRYPESPALAKLEGMLRFRLEGALPLERQVWPEPVAPLREGLLATLLAGAGRAA